MFFCNGFWNKLVNVSISIDIILFQFIVGVINVTISKVCESTFLKERKTVEEIVNFDYFLLVTPWFFLHETSTTYEKYIFLRKVFELERIKKDQ